MRSRSLACRVSRAATWRARAEASAPSAARISARRVEKARRCSAIEALDLGDAVARPPATGPRAAGSARGGGAPRRCSRRSSRGRRSPGGRAGSSGRPARGSRWRRGRGCGAGGRRRGRSGGRRRRRGSRCRGRTRGRRGRAGSSRPAAPCRRGRRRRTRGGPRSPGPGAGWPPSAQVSETDFGAEKVRSKPGTGLAPGDVTEAERLAGRRVAAGQHRGQAVGVDLAVEAEVGGGRADPVALGLTAAGVVVLGAFGDPSRCSSAPGRRRASRSRASPGMSAGGVGIRRGRGPYP